MKLRKKFPVIIFAVFLFLFLLLFYSVEHPLYVYDSDDWTYISYSRHIWPSTSLWNPTRILPEILMPLVAQIGISVIMPFTGDYVGAMAYAFALALSAFIAVYILAFGKFMYGRFAHGSENLEILPMVILFLLCFLPFMTDSLENEYLFYANSVTTYFYYIIPALLNGSAVLFMFSTDCHSFLRDSNAIKAGFFILLVYLCINSNMFQSIIIASYAGAHLLLAFVSGFKKFTLKKIVSQNFNQVFIICIWFISLIFESQGGRSTGLINSHVINIGETVGLFFQSLLRFRKFYIFQLCFVVCFALLVAFISYRKLRHEQKKLVPERVLFRIYAVSVIAGITTVLYLILLCSIVNGVYILRTDCMISWVFWLFVLEAASLGYIVKRVPKSALMFPLFALCLLFETFMHGSRYKDISYGDPDALKAVDEYIIQQVLEAEKSGESYAEVHIPSYSDASWPLNTEWGGGRLSVTLYRHGIIKDEMEIVFVPDEAVNEVFQL